jgi:PAB-dependent poly(A)-specific ribonuclease subunit 2
MTYRAIQPIVGFDDTRQSVTALAFDPVSDALWSGYNNGAIVAYYGSDRPARGVSFPVGGKQAVSKIVVGESYVRAVGLRSGGVGTWGKGGANKWFYK